MPPEGEDPTTDGSAYLDVSSRAVARYLGLTLDAVQVAVAAGLLPEHHSGRAKPGSRERASLNAPDAIALKTRPYVTADELARFPPGSILLVQQTFERPEDSDWRTAYGWSTRLSPRQAVDSARGWWPVGDESRDQVRAIVSTVSSFVVTLAVVDPRRGVDAVHPDGRVRYRASPATRHTSVGKLLLDTFAGRRVPLRFGSSRLLP